MEKNTHKNLGHFFTPIRKNGKKQILFFGLKKEVGANFILMWFEHEYVS